jgi:glutaredoxin
MMKVIRFVLGKIILFFDELFEPAGLVRTAEAQRQIESEIKAWQLYQLQACPFCVKVRRELKRLSLTIPTREIAKDAAAHSELMAGGKLDQVPCLMIPGANGQAQWLYESSEIIELLRNRFGAQIS